MSDNSMRVRHDALLDIIRQCKRPEISDLDAALNVIESHAEEIKKLRSRIEKLRSVMSETADALTLVVDTEDQEETE